MSMGPPPPPPGPGPYDQPFGGPYQPPYGGGYGPRDHPQGTTILVLGILSLVLCGGVLGPVAWVMGNNALREIDANPTAYTNRGTVQAGRICGIIATCLLVLAVLAVILLVVAGTAASSSR